MAAPDLGASSLDDEENMSRATLFKLAMKGNWDKIVEQYRVDPYSHSQKITWLGDTALHVAVADGLDDIVELLIEAIWQSSIQKEKENEEVLAEEGSQFLDLEAAGIERFNGVLKIKNSDGNTPLHVAASMGGATMCAVIVCPDRYIDRYYLTDEKRQELKDSINEKAKSDVNIDDGQTTAELENISTDDDQKTPEILENITDDQVREEARRKAQSHINDLLEQRNNDGETPLFLAARMGHMDAFLFLTEICDPRQTNDSYTHCTRKDGKNILHTAIAGQYFDLAFQIIWLYKSLVERVNEDGDTPLEALARKPSAFKSGSKLGRWEKLIYECISVNPLKEDFSYAKDKSSLNDVGKENNNTWSTCLHFLRNVYLLVNPKDHAFGRPKADPETPMEDDGTGKQLASGGAQRPLWSRLVKQITTSMAVVLGMGQGRVNRIKRQKEKHTWSVQVMHKLIENSPTMYAFDKGGEWYEETDTEILEAEFKKETKNEEPKPSRTKATKETAILIAAKNGIKEMVEVILQKFPVAVYDLDAEKKNIVLLAVETRQLELYKMLLDSYSPHSVPSPRHPSQASDGDSGQEDNQRPAPLLLNFYQEDDQKPDPLHVKDNAFRMVDSNGNSALHLAAKLKENHEPWPIPGSALQMQWEIKWHKFVERSMPENFFILYNEMGETPEYIFTESHKNLVKEGVDWLIHTSESCSVVAALIATVAFATSTAVPGGTNEENGKPTLENQFAFKLFGITSLISLCFSITSLSMFLSILTSRYQEKDFGRSLPWKLLLGLTSLFVSIASVLVSFCSGHFFVLGDTLKFAAFPVYAVTCLPISFFAAAQFPLYFDLIQATFRSPFGGSSRRKRKFKNLRQKMKKRQ